MQASRISTEQAEYGGGHRQGKNKDLSKKLNLRAPNVKINTGIFGGDVNFSTINYF